MESPRLSNAQLEALLRAYDERRDGGTLIPAQTARVLERLKLIRSMDKPGAARLGLDTGRWGATREGCGWLAVHGYRFGWGRVREVHRIGDSYAIVEYDKRKADNVADDDWEPSVGFHPYHLLDGRWYDTSHSYSSLDAALISCVVFKHTERRHGINAALNERATGYIMKMIEAKEE